MYFLFYYVKIEQYILNKNKKNQPMQVNGLYEIKTLLLVPGFQQVEKRYPSE